MTSEDEARNNRWLRRGAIVAALAIAIALASAAVAVAVFLWSLRASYVAVKNDTDGHVVVSLGTRIVVDLAPRSTVTMKRRGESGPLRIEAGSSYKECSWDAARDQQPLLIDADGVHCHDTRADAPPYPTPVPP